MNRMGVHKDAMTCSGNLKREEIRLIDLLQIVEEKRIFDDLRCPSLYRYCLDYLKLSEDRTLNYMRIIKKAKEVPALTEAIRDGKIHISHARKITSVITKENQHAWLEKAQELSVRALEREVAIANPKEAVRERIKPIAPKLYELRCSLSEQAEVLLKRAQDLLSQKKGHATDIAETLESLLKDFVERQDPVKKAERSEVRKSKSPVTGPVPAMKKGKRTAIPKPIQHPVMKEAQGQCMHVDSNGLRCPNRRWMHWHHKTPVARGGMHSLENLVLLCSSHHRLEHRS